MFLNVNAPLLVLINDVEGIVIELQNGSRSTGKSKPHAYKVKTVLLTPLCPCFLPGAWPGDSENRHYKNDYPVLLE